MPWFDEPGLRLPVRTPVEEKPQRIVLSPKQAKAWGHLDDPTITEVFAGGGAGGGKTMLGCTRQIFRRTAYAGTRGFIGRESFTGLRDSTMKTYFEVLAQMGYESNVHYRYNAQEHTIYFDNGSEQHFRHMAYMPSDPDYNRFGSTEYTDAFVDEAPEVAERACQVLLSRLRYKHKQFGITPEVLYTGNPGESWVKAGFVMDEYGNFIELPSHRARVLFTIMDNPDVELRESYTRTLNMLDDYDRARLLYGDWTARPEVTRPFAHAFDRSKHVSSDIVFRPHLPIRISVDFNYEPFCAIIANQWRDQQGEHLHIFHEISISQGSIEEMAKQIRSVIGNATNYEVTGDRMGNSRRVKLKDSDNTRLFDQLRADLRASKSQFILPRNPFHKESRHNYNFMLNNYPDFKISDKCVHLIADHRNVEVDEHGSIIKSNRDKESQRADFIDCARYLENTHLATWRRIHMK